jgi:hypothetical protein
MQEVKKMLWSFEARESDERVKRQPLYLSPPPIYFIFGSYSCKETIL